MSDVLTITELISAQSVHCGFQAGSRKRLFQAIAQELVDPARDDSEEAIDEIYEALVERERLGSTALGDGVAIPHCRTDCQRISGAFYTLAEAVDYEAPDQRPVDLVFVLLVPEDEKTAHIFALQRLAQLFSDPAHQQRLRAAATDEALFDEISHLDAELGTVAAKRKFA